jgi:hypothetical protein
MSSPESRGTQDRAFRPLSDLEGKLLSVLLGTDFPGREALKKQVAVALVREIDDNGSLEFARSDETPAEVVRRIPVEAELDDSDGVTIHLLLHVVDGLVKELEVYRDDSGRVQRTLTPQDLRLMVL